MHLIKRRLDLIKRRLHFHIATHVMCPWSFILLYHYIDCFWSQLGYLLSILIVILIEFLPIALMLALRTHDIMIFRRMNGKLTSKNFFWKWISRTEGEIYEMGIPNSRERSRLNYTDNDNGDVPIIVVNV